MKKAIAILVSMLLMMTVCMTGSAAAAFDLTIGSVEGEAGAIVEVPVVVNANAGIWGAQFEVSYDKDVLTYKEAVWADAFKADFGPLVNEGDALTLQLVANGFEDVKTTGTLVTLKFEIAAGAAAGAAADITATFNPNNNINASGENVDTAVAAGKVTVAAPTTAPTTEPTTAPTTAPTTEPTVAPTTAPTEAPTTTTTQSPATGSALPVAAIVLAAGSAAVLTFARKK